MTQKLVHALALTAALALGGTLTAQAAAPVAKVAAYQGGVEYSRDGEQWHALTRPNKYLLPGYQLRTAAGASAEILIQASGEVRSLAASSTVRFGSDSVELVSGEISQPESRSGSYAQSLYNKFLTSQRYTTVRRSSAGDPGNLKTIRALTVSSTYPDFVWENVGPQYSYIVRVGGGIHEIPATSGDMVRFAIPALSPGEHELTVSVVHDGEVLHTSRPTRLTWLNPAENDRYIARELSLQSGAYADAIELAAFQSESGFKVAALDTYRAFFARYPDENEVRPMLAQAYAELYLRGLQSREAAMYQQMAWGGGE